MHNGVKSQLHSYACTPTILLTLKLCLPIQHIAWPATRDPGPSILSITCHATPRANCCDAIYLNYLKSKISVLSLSLIPGYKKNRTRLVIDLQASFPCHIEPVTHSMPHRSTV